MPMLTPTWAVAEVTDQNSIASTMIKERIFLPLLECLHGASNEPDIAHCFPSLQPQGGLGSRGWLAGPDSERRTVCMAIPWRSQECKKPTPGDWLSARSSIKFFGSPTWARTKDLRINSRTHSLPDGS